MPEKPRVHAPERTVAYARELRRDMSLPEVVLWDCLRGRRTDAQDVLDDATLDGVLGTVAAIVAERRKR